MIRDDRRAVKIEVSLEPTALGAASLAATPIAQVTRLCQGGNPVVQFTIVSVLGVLCSL